MTVLSTAKPHRLDRKRKIRYNTLVIVNFVSFQFYEITLSKKKKGYLRICQENIVRYLNKIMKQP